MKIFLTGGTGFVGSHFVKLAVTKSHRIKAICRESPQDCETAPQDSIKWISKRLSEIDSEDIRGHDVIVHFAASGVTPQPCSWESAFETNVSHTLRLMKLAKEAGINRFVAAGTYAEYGKAGLRYEQIPPNAPLEPTDPYAASKAAASIALASFARANKMELFYGRIFSAFGEGQHPSNFWPQLRHAAISGQDFEMTLGEQIRDFIPVEQVAARFLAACEEDIEGGTPKIINVASGIPTTLAGFARCWWQKFGASGKLLIGSTPYRPNEVMRYIAEIA